MMSTDRDAWPRNDDTYPYKRRKVTNNVCKEMEERIKKIPTYYRRKAEMDRLERERKELEMIVKNLRVQADFLRPREALQRRQQNNKILREALHTQRRVFAGAASIVAHFSREKCTKPFDTPTILSRDPIKRQETLLKMRNDHLSCAYEFMMEKLQHMDITLDYCEQKKFKTLNGDMCSERFEIIPLPSATSVKRVFDALEAFVSTVEITMTEVDGDITVRENDEPQHLTRSPVAQHRLVTTIANLVQMDTNNASFSEYIPPSPGVREVGFSISEPIGEDELYPYKPESRIRQDLTIIVMVFQSADKDGNALIVFSRWWSLCIRKSHIPVPKFITDRIQNGLEAIAASMLTVAEHADVAGACNIP